LAAFSFYPHFMNTPVFQLYDTILEQHQALWNRLKNRYNLVSAIRLLIALLFLGSLYTYLKTDNGLWLCGIFAAAIVFAVCMAIHQRLDWKKKLAETLVIVNKNELTYLQQRGIPFENGVEFNHPAHAYANDLDIFGHQSLYQHLNRTATHVGRTSFAELLLTLLPSEEINANQAAIQELSGKIHWRQETQAIGKMTGDNKTVYEQLIRWSKSPVSTIPGWLTIAAFALPVVLLTVLGFYGFTQDTFYSDLAFKLFPINLLVLFSQAKKIRAENIAADKVHDIIKKYGILLEKIENESFNSVRLNELKSKLRSANGAASLEIKKLSVLFSNLDNLNNAFGAVLLNGFLLYHLHVYRTLLQWKKAHAPQVAQWMEVLGAIEALNSLANLAHNNPDFTYPTLNEQYEISFEALGHPLIPRTKNVRNDIAFNDHRFLILTGSNMSGKSTFLRTLGINMVLAGIGAPVCARAARVHPLPVLVSMRQSDSLADSESYFFAEVKRLQYIIQQASHRRSFVLLDEILRGTNSDDKRSGTIGVIEKVIALQTIGAIATHDLEVCHTTDKHPDILSNQCFEVEIIHDELVFDYQLRPGICKNKSATFLMKKMEII